MSSLLPNSQEDLNHRPVWGGTSTRHINSPHAQLSISTIKDARGTGQPTSTIQPNLSSHTSFFDTSDSSTNFPISHLKPHPTPSQGSAIILPHIESNVFFVIMLPSGSWNAIQLPLTKSVTRSDLSSIGGCIELLLLVRGCEQCRRTGNNMGPPSLIDSHTPSDDVTPRDGTIQVHFTFSSHSRHHRKEDEGHVYVAVA